MELKMKYISLLPFILMCFLLSHAYATEEVFVGKYSASERESLSELYLLNNNTFCYVFMGGSLDLMLAGTWQKSDQHKNTIILKETKTNNVIHPAQAQQLNRLDNKISITINGYSLVDVNTAVFGFSKGDTPPTTLRPLLPKNNNTGRANYTFPLLSPSSAKYFYVGHIDHKNKKILQVTQYAIGDNDTIRIGFNNSQESMFPEPSFAQLIDNNLHLNGDYFSPKTGLKQQMQNEVYKHCIAQKNDVIDSEWSTLSPTKTLYFNKNAVKGEPYFNENDGEEARQENGISTLILNEKKLLESHFQQTKKDLTNLDDLLTISLDLLQIKQRKNIYAPLISLKLSQILINTINQGNINSAEKQFNAYTTQVYPLIKDSTNKQVQYSVLVMASQGIIIYGKNSDKEIFHTVLNTLLGPNFNIETTINPTLAYNLACIYALNKNKPEMLIAIRAARKMKKPTELFLKDSDFSFYQKDNDFLAAIR
jgi:hypothetical protein